MSLKRSFYDILYVLVGYVASSFLGLAILFILARNLGPAGYGTYALFLLVGSFFLIFSGSWIIRPAVVRFGKEELMKMQNIRATFQTEVVLLPFILLLSGIVLWLLKSKIISFIGLHGNVVFYLILYLIVFSFCQLFQEIFKAQADFKAFGFLVLIKNIFFFAMMFIAIIASKNELTVERVILFYLISYMLVVFLSFLKLKDLNLFAWERKPQIYKFLSFSWPFIFAGCATFVLYYIDKIFIRIFMGNYEVGIYVMASVLSIQLMALPEQLPNVVFPIITSYRVAEKKENIRIFIERFLPQISMFISAIALLGIVFSDLLVIFAGYEYTRSIAPFIILIAARTFVVVNTYYLCIIMAYDHTKLAGGISTVAAISNIILTYFLIKIFGIIGVAVATLLAFSIGGFLMALFISKRFNVKGMKALYYILPVVIIGAIWLIIKNYFIKLAFLFAIVFISYFVIKKAGVFKKEDAQIFDKIDLPSALRVFLNKAYAFLS